MMAMLMYKSKGHRIVLKSNSSTALAPEAYLKTIVVSMTASVNTAMIFPLHSGTIKANIWLEYLL